MSELIVIAYDDKHQAEQVRMQLLRLERGHLVDLEDAVVVTRDDKGKVRLNQIHNLTAAGAMTGGFWGALIGLIFMSPLLGIAAGAAAGAVGGALSDIGIEDEFMRELGRQLRPGTSALFVLVRKVTMDRVLPEIQPYGGKVLRTSLSQVDEQMLADALTHAREAA